tara:strand:+ start:10619 stop:10969 length:351 start_codon:yes stop_codon:yes gene_type:complete
MKNTYWEGKGTYQEISDKLEEMVPASGACYNIPEDEESGINKPLDMFRETVNAYYDIFNNGGCNSANRRVSYYFPGVMSVINRNYRNIDWQLVESIVEPIMDKRVLLTAKKMNLFS